VDEAGSREGGEAFEVRWEVGLTTVARSLDYVLLLLTYMIYERRGNYFGMEYTSLFLAVLQTVQRDVPFPNLSIPRRIGDICLSPGIELKQLHEGLEPVSEFILCCPNQYFFRFWYYRFINPKRTNYLWGKNRPTLREWEVRKMIKPNGIMQHELMIPRAPVISNSLFFINDQGFDP
jgi:hypothetical protein